MRCCCKRKTILTMFGQTRFGKLENHIDYHNCRKKLELSMFLMKRITGFKLKTPIIINYDNFFFEMCVSFVIIMLTFCFGRFKVAYIANYSQYRYKILHFYYTAIYRAVFEILLFRIYNLYHSPQ